MKISEQQMAAFESRLRLSFEQWLEKYSAIVGDFDAEEAARTLEAVREEARESGIDTEPRLFTYAASRLLMPAMNGLQYFEVMDLVFAPLPDADILHRLVFIREHPDG